MKLEEKIQGQISDDIQNLGFEIEYIEYVKEGKDNVLRIVIDKKDITVSVDDCELISRNIEDKIDKNMPSDKQYILEVSSAGLERQLKNIGLYQKYINKKVHVKLYKKITDLGKEFDAILVNVDQEAKNIELSVASHSYILNISEIANAHTVFDYDKLFKINKKSKN